MSKKFINMLLGVMSAMVICCTSVPEIIFNTETISSSAENEKETETEEKKNEYEKIPVDYFRVSNLSPNTESELDYTDWWYSEWEDCRYIFLPTMADRSKLTVEFSSEEQIYLNDKSVKSGEVCTMLADNDEFSVKVGKTDCGTLKIMQSNLGCIFIGTDSGTIDKLDSNVNYVEEGSALMLNSEGKTEYDGYFEKLTSHGNSSWGYSKKKSYNVKLPEKANLFGMGKAKKWVLLSNYLDHSMLRNKTAEELSRAVGIDYVMDSTFVDLYADGSYRGTYQLYEKVQVQKQRVNITELGELTEELNRDELKSYRHKADGAPNTKSFYENSCKYYDIPKNPDDITGGYLIQFQIWDRYANNTDSGFVTSRGQAFSVSCPEYASKEQIMYIRSFVQELEDAIYSDTGYNSKGKHFSEYVDVESLVKAYLLQETTMNTDSSYSSFFFWKESDSKGDGKLHYGPPWDFDFTFSNISTARRNSYGDLGFAALHNNLFTAYFPINGYNDGYNPNPAPRPVYGVSWLGKLYRNDDFRRLAAKIYYDKFNPIMTEFTNKYNSTIFRWANEIKPSAEMNNARWHTYGGREYLIFGYSSGEDFLGSVELVRDYAEKRTKWLASTWKYDAYIQGDVNEDNKFNIADVISVQHYLLNPDTKLKNMIAADFDYDFKLDSLDLAILKNMIISQ